MKNDSVGLLAEYLRAASQVAVLTGAGMSTESGIPDFRSPDGLYSTGVSEDIFCIDRFARDPARFYRWLTVFWPLVTHAVPHSGYRALAELELRHGKKVSVGTQNIDGLHEAAGSTTVFRLHGSLQTASCQDCGQQQTTAAILENMVDGIAVHDGCGGLWKPDIVFFGEQLPENEWSAACTALREADLVLVAGTSLTVYPAASLPSLRPAGSRLVIINRAATSQDMEADLVIRQDIGQVLSQVLALV